jgi:flagellin
MENLTMPNVINTNLAALNAQKNLARAQDSMATTMQRLSSGLRINSAKDDAAGLAITERQSAQIRGMNQAIRNANDGISLAQTGESALNEVASNLQRMRELAVQSANGVYSQSDRISMQKEVQALQKEIARSLQITNFNGRLMFFSGQGTDFASSMAFQVGANEATYSNGTWSANPNRIDFRMQFNTLATADGLGYWGKSDTIRHGSVNGVNSFETTQAITLFDVMTSCRIFSYNLTTHAVSGGTLDANAGMVKNSDVLSIATMTGAQFAINWVDTALDVVNNVRASFGALQNRFESTVRNLQDNIESTTAAQSRIRDADFAAETANLTKYQIIQQAGTAMLAQANQQPQQVLRLLQ